MKKRSCDTSICNPKRNVRGKKTTALLKYNQGDDYHKEMYTKLSGIAREMVTLSGKTLKLESALEEIEFFISKNDELINYQRKEGECATCQETDNIERLYAFSRYIREKEKKKGDNKRVAWKEARKEIADLIYSEM